MACTRGQGLQPGMQEVAHPAHHAVADVAGGGVVVGLQRSDPHPRRGEAAGPAGGDSLPPWALGGSRPAHLERELERPGVHALAQLQDVGLWPVQGKNGVRATRRAGGGGGSEASSLAARHIVSPRLPHAIAGAGLPVREQGGAPCDGNLRVVAPQQVAGLLLRIRRRRGCCAAGSDGLGGRHRELPPGLGHVGLTGCLAM